MPDLTPEEEARERRVFAAGLTPARQHDKQEALERAEARALEYEREATQAKLDVQAEATLAASARRRCEAAEQRIRELEGERDGATRCVQAISAKVLDWHPPLSSRLGPGPAIDNLVSIAEVGRRLRGSLERIAYREESSDGEVASMRWIAREALGWVCAGCEGRGVLMERDGSKYQRCADCGGSGDTALAAVPEEAPDA